MTKPQRRTENAGTARVNRGSRRKSAMQSLSSTVDGPLLAVVVVLLIYGFLTLFSATFYLSDKYWQKQLIWIVVSAVVAYGLYRVPYPIWQKGALGLMAVNLVLLLITVFLSLPVFGGTSGLVDLSESTRDVGSLFGIAGSVQPGVLARLVTVIYIAAWLSSKGDQLNQLSYGLFPFGVIVGLVGGLVALQPDLSTTMLIVGTGLAMFLFAGGDPLQIFISILMVGATGGFVVWRIPYARQRLELHLASLSNPEQLHPQVLRSMQAISDGGLLGKGLGYGRLKFGYLSVPWTDSIFAVVGEEVGLVGCLLVIGLFIYFAVRGYRIALGTSDPFGSLVAFGVTTMVLFEALLNVAVSIGLFPITGTALPFFSYGGTEMLMVLSGVGLLMTISRGRPKGDWDALLDRWWRDGWARLPGASRGTGFARHRS